MKKVFLALFVCFSIFILISCNLNENNDSGIKEIVADGRNLNSLNLTPGKEYILTLSEGAQFSIGGDNEFNMFSFEVEESGNRGLNTRNAKKPEREDMICNNDWYIAYSDPTNKGFFDASDFSSHEGNVRIKVSLLDGNTVISWDEIKQARNTGKNVVSEAFFATPKELLAKGLISDIKNVTLSQTYTIAVDGPHGYGDCTYGLVIDGKIYTQDSDFTQGVIDLTPYAEKKIGFYNSVKNPTGNTVSMHLNINSAKAISPKDTDPVSLESCSTVLRINKNSLEESKNYVVELTVNNTDLRGKVDFPALSLRDTQGKYLNIVSLPFMLTGDDKNTICIYLGKITEDVLLNCNIKEYTQTGPFGSVVIKEFKSENYDGWTFSDNTINIDSHSNIKVGDSPARFPISLTIPVGGGMHSYVLYDESNGNYEIKVDYKENKDETMINYSHYCIQSGEYIRPGAYGKDHFNSNKSSKDGYPILEFGSNKNFAIIEFGTFSKKEGNHPDKNSTNSISIELTITKVD